jgi:V/A-type H+-transporting ATPase subunit F
MKYFVIGDEDTVIGFRYAGVDGEMVALPEQAKSAFNKAINSPDVGILIITQQIAQSLADVIEAKRMEGGTPVIVEIPDRNGPLEGRKTLIEMIREAIGIRI